MLRLMRAAPDMQRGLNDLIEWANPTAWRLLEIGSYAGESAAIFAASGRFSEIVCVDSWHTPDTQLAERYFDLRARHYHLTKLKLDSRKAATRFPDASLDMVYIDAWHMYEHVMRDITAWRPKVRAGGVISGHDYMLDSTPPPDPGVEPHRYWPDVVKAVDDVFGSPHIVTIDGSWAVRL